MDLFIANGFSATTVDMVAHKSALNKRTIYSLVGDKKKLFFEVCRDVAAIDELDLSDAIDRSSLRNSLLRLGERLLKSSLSKRTIALERTTIAASHHFPELIHEIVTATYQEANRKVSSYFEVLQSIGMIQMKDGIDSGELFFDVIIGQLAHRLISGQEPFYPDDKYLERRVDFFIRGHGG